MKNAYGDEHPEIQNSKFFLTVGFKEIKTDEKKKKELKFLIDRCKQTIL